MGDACLDLPRAGPGGSRVYLQQRVPVSAALVHTPALAPLSHLSGRN